jgi:hypothetical protein
MQIFSLQTMSLILLDLAYLDRNTWAMTTDTHSLDSSLREKILEHLFVRP